MGHARALVGVNDADTQRKIAQNIVGQGLSVRDTEKLIKRVASNTLANMPIARISPAENPNVRAAEVKLRRRLGTQVRVLPNQTGTGGVIEIEYYSESDLDRFYKILVAADDDESSH